MLFLLSEMTLQTLKSKSASGHLSQHGPRAEASAARPMRELLRRLPLLTRADKVTSAVAEDAGDLAALAASAEATARTIHLGVGALGHLMARCAMDLQDGSVAPDCIENLGFLMAELGDLAAECTRIAGDCRASHHARQGMVAHDPGA
ncbi:hypothetical protein [Ramlibacter sp. AN1133]|uniref:hypothetical protein n=1 Tax=Ramlibacter sp. AN1133 TaxID=3133429 RepID=UPI0030C576A0